MIIISINAALQGWPSTIIHPALQRHYIQITLCQRKSSRIRQRNHENYENQCSSQQFKGSLHLKGKRRVLSVLKGRLDMIISLSEWSQPQYNPPMNRFQRAASKHAYYNYVNRFAPETLRTYQSQRFYCLGRRGAYDTLVYKMAADHINYEEEMNQQYKTPTAIVNLWMRVGIFLFVVPSFMIMFNFDDLVRIFQAHKYTYIGNATDTVIPLRYETLYAIDRIPYF